MAVVGFEAPLAHFHYDVFTVPEDVPQQIDSLSGRRVQFFYSNKGDIDRVAMCKASLEAFQAAWKAKALTEAQWHAAIASCAEGYPFPTNLDTDPPIGGLAPESQASMMKRAIIDGMPSEAFFEILDAQEMRQRA